MKEFFNNILLVFGNIGNADKHQKKLFYGSIIIYLLLGIIFGYLSSVVFTAVLAFVYELTYCYVPYKEKAIWHWNIVLPDYGEFRSRLSEMDFTEYHKFEKRNVYFSVCGIAIGIIIRLILWIL